MIPAPVSDAAPPAEDEVRADERRPDRSADRQADFSGMQWGFLVLVTVVAALLRLVSIGEWPVWVDEAHSWRDATLPLGEFLEQSRRWYPTSYFLLRGLLETGLLPGEEPAFLRLPFALAGIATVPVLAVYGRRIVGPAAAVWAASFLALHPWHVYWSQNARAYALVVLFATVAVGELVRGRLERSRARQVWALAWLGLAASCHLTALVLVPVFAGVWLLGSARLDRRRAIPLLASFTVLLLVLRPLLELFPPFRVFLDAKSLAVPSLQHFVETVAWYFRVPFLCAAALGAWLLGREKGGGGSLPLLLWAAAPLLLLAAVGSGIVKVTGRYALTALPAVLLLAGAASARIGTAVAHGLSLGRRERLAAFCALPMLLLADAGSGCLLYHSAWNGDRGRWDEAARTLTALAGGQPFVVHTTHEPVLLYYLRPGHYRASPEQRVTGPIDVRSIERADVEASAAGRPEPGRAYVRSIVDQARRRGRRALFAAALPELAEKDDDGSLRRALAEQCELVEVLPLWVGPRDESVYVWSAR